MFDNLTTPEVQALADDVYARRFEIAADIATRAAVADTPEPPTLTTSDYRTAEAQHHFHVAVQPRQTHADLAVLA